MTQGVLDFEEALLQVMRHASEFCINMARVLEEVPLLDAVGRTLALPIFADRDQPPFDRSTRDGFAVKAAEFCAGSTLRIVGLVRAGDIWNGEPLRGGEAIEIMTGAPVPGGADAVAMVEHVSLGKETLEVGTVRSAQGRTLRTGENIVPHGSEARTGEIVAQAGSSIGAAEIALAAAVGLSTLAVHAKPTVAIIATGDELVELHQTPDLRQIRNSNSYALAALVAAAGGTPHRLAIARDLREELFRRIDEARQSDLILFSGGVSMGKYDLVEEVLAELGAKFFFTGVKMQPGKPVVFGYLPERREAAVHHPGRFFFGLPGNPVSTQVTFHCFVEPLLRRFLGEEAVGPRFVQATLTHDVQGRPGITRALPAHLVPHLKQPSITLIGWQGSGDLTANARANCYAMFPPERDQFHAGEVISVLLR